MIHVPRIDFIDWVRSKHIEKSYFIQLGRIGMGWMWHPGSQSRTFHVWRLTEEPSAIDNLTEIQRIRKKDSEFMKIVLR